MQVLTREVTSVTSARHHPELVSEGRRVIKSGDVERIIALLDSPNGLVQREALDAIRKRRLFEAAPALEQMQDLDDKFLRAGAMRALVEFALAESRRVFLKGLSDSSDIVRLYALQGLVAINDPSVIKASEDFYSTGKSVMKQEALHWLERVDGKEALESLSRMLENERSWLWRRRIKKTIKTSEAATYEGESG